MANSKAGQYQIEYRLEGFVNPTRSHVVRAWVSASGSPVVGALPADVQIQKRGGTTASLQSVADQFWSFLRLSYGVTITAANFSLWRFATENARDFISGGSVANPAGTGASPVIAGQCTLTFRHALGGIGKIVLLESGNGGDSRSSLIANAAGSATQRLAAYLMSADSPMVALDNSFPVTPLRDSRGQNEAIWRLVYRSGS
jgi:hypothetical protein